MERLNQTFARNLKAKFTITLGDEFEGLLSVKGAQDAIPDLIWTIEETFEDVDFRIGIGLGAIDTDLPEYASSVDGPAFHKGREAINFAAKKHQMGGVFRGYGDSHDQILNGLARVLHRHRHSWSAQQRRVASLLRTGLNQTDAAFAMGLSKQAISAYAGVADWEAYKEGENAWRKALEEALRNVH
jgi:hypothetical protein